MYRPLRALPLGAAASLLALSCASPSTPAPTATTQPAPLDATSSLTQRAVALGVSPTASDESGPRFLRAVARLEAPAGLSPADSARAHVAKLTGLWIKNGSPAGLDLIASRTLAGGAHLVTFQQRVNGIDVHGGEIRVLLNKDRSLVAVAGTLRSRDLADKGSFKRDARDTVAAALSNHFGVAFNAKTLAVTTKAGGLHKVQVGPRSDLNVPVSSARPVYVPAKGGLVRAWRTEFIASRAINGDVQGMEYLVRDNDGAFLRKTDLRSDLAFRYRVFAEPGQGGQPTAGPVEDFLPHPTGLPDRSPDAAPPQLVEIDGFNAHGDPWLPDNAVTTQGNNAWAYTDWNNTDNPESANVFARTNGTRTFDYTYDVNAEPMSSATQVQAAVVNLFYIVNWMHDWYYDSGFDEAHGNGQISNFGRGGLELDPSFLNAQDNTLADGERNNANMFTPSDGNVSLMQMYLWRGATISASVDAPSLGGAIAAGGASFGPNSFDLPGDVAIATDGTAAPDGGTVTDGCEAITSDVTGKIALIDRGLCSFEVKAGNAQAAGAIGVIVANNRAGDMPEPLGSDGDRPGLITVPTLSVSQADGTRIRDAVGAGTLSVTLHYRSETERDGDLDNGIVGHEWGHFIHLRSTRCFRNPQCGAMSEGTADFIALHLLLEEGDDHHGVFSASTYAGGDDPEAVFFGVRRYAYSADRTKNSLSFRHIMNGEPLPTDVPHVPFAGDNAEVHSAGEIWATMLWDAYVALIDEHGYQDARRRMSNYLIAGMQLVPTGEITYLDQRDAILAATGAMDAADGLLLAQAFAGRGAGTCALGPAADSEDFLGVVESNTLAGIVALGTPTLVDDGVSCDGDDILDAGESGVLRLPLSTPGPGAGADSGGEASTTTAGVTLGQPTVTATLAPFATQVVEIPVTLAADAVPGTALTIELSATATGGCSTDPITTSLTVSTGVDEAASSATDNVEARSTAWTRSAGLGEQLWDRLPIAADNTIWFGTNAGIISDTTLTSPVLTVGAEPLVVTFDHAYAIEGDPSDAFYDGAMIEVTSDGGDTWVDVEELGLTPGYAGEISDCCENPLAGRRAFSGVSEGYPTVAPLSLDFGTRFANQSVQIRFRIATDASAFFDGWVIDNIAVTGITNAPFFVSTPETGVCSELVVSAGPDQEVAHGSTVTLAGTATDPTGDPRTITWSQVSGPTVTLSDTASLTPTFTAPNSAGPATIELSLTVRDGEQTKTDTVVINVVANPRPVVDAGADQTVAGGATVTLTGTVTDTDVITTEWTLVSGPPVVLTGADTLTATFTAPIVTEETVLVFRLSATDAITTVSDEVQVTISADPTPDAGTPDAGTPSPDAGTPRPDAGGGGDDDGDDDGCGCSTTSPAAAGNLLLPLAAVLLALRRRRKKS
jgi:MYXO-CTERM domain-containing protein